MQNRSQEIVTKEQFLAAVDKLDLAQLDNLKRADLINSIISYIVANKTNADALNAKTKNGETVFTVAARRGIIPIIQELLKLNSIISKIINVPNRLGQTPLMQACLYAQRDVINCLFSCEELDVNAENLRVNTAFYSTVMRAQVEVVQLLLEHKQAEIFAYHDFAQINKALNHSIKEARLAQSPELSQYLENVQIIKTMLPLVIKVKRPLNEKMALNMCVTRLAVIHKNEEYSPLIAMEQLERVKFLLADKKFSSKPKYSKLLQDVVNSAAQTLDNMLDNSQELTKTVDSLLGNLKKYYIDNHLEYPEVDITEDFTPYESTQVSSTPTSISKQDAPSRSDSNSKVSMYDFEEEFSSFESSGFNSLSPTSRTSQDSERESFKSISASQGSDYEVLMEPDDFVSAQDLIEDTSRNSLDDAVPTLKKEKSAPRKISITDTRFGFYSGTSKSQKEDTPSNENTQNKSTPGKNNP